MFRVANNPSWTQLGHPGQSDFPTCWTQAETLGDVGVQDILLQGREEEKEIIPFRRQSFIPAGRNPNLGVGISVPFDVLLPQNTPAARRNCGNSQDSNVFTLQ